MLTIEPNTAPWGVTLIHQLNLILFGATKLPVRLPEFTVANLPTASRYRGCHINVSDETGGYTGAYSDGSNWRRYADRAVVS